MALKHVEPSDSGGVRSALNKNPMVVGGAILAVIVAFVAYMWWPVSNGGDYYTTDDGASWFKDSGKTPPFTKSGKEAVRAVMYTCDGGKTLFVGYLLRFTPEGKAREEANIAAHRSEPSSGYEVKRPGEKEWVSPVDMSKPNPGMTPTTIRDRNEKYKSVRIVKCPDGNGTPIQLNVE